MPKKLLTAKNAKAAKSKVVGRGRGPSTRTSRAVRACLRCGCTDDRACAGGCSWIHNSSVCDACADNGESMIWLLLQQEFQDANSDQLRVRAVNRMETFARYLDKTSYDMPIPYVPVQKGGGK
jgi:hypothetical protein